ncbi:MAG: nickel ABC transporter permease subunit NikC [Desulfovibrio sp.]|jgi:nickel transport system permease protein|nr:nickel ABC transporter permease subunit NikC [Desulfovibrio sp.]
MSPEALDAAAPFTAPAPVPDAAPGNTLLRQLLSRPTALAALALLCIILSMAVFAPYLSPRHPADVDITRKFEAPSLEEPLGTDHLGRSVLARLCHGTRVSLFAVGAILTCIVAVGLTAGCVAGYAGGRVDGLLMRACDVFMTFPTFILALFLVGVLGSGLTNVIIAVACTHWAWYARFARGLVLGLKQREYVLAARAAGTRPTRLVLRHILPPVLAQMLVMAGLDVGHMLLHVSGLSFLGLGVRPPTPEWGVMIGDAREYIGTHPELLLYPGLMIFVTVMAFNLLGDALRDALDPAAARETERDAACGAHGPDGTDGLDGLDGPGELDEPDEPDEPGEPGEPDEPDEPGERDEFGAAGGEDDSPTDFHGVRAGAREGAA